MAKEQVEILGIPGSLRRDSYNRWLLLAAQQLAPEHVHLKLFDLHDVPLYNADVEAEGDPPAVVDLKQAISAADGLLIATPEYNHSIPAVLKNALDWASRPPEEVLAGKPVALVGASPGGFGSARAQVALKPVLATAGSYLLPSPQLWVSGAASKFDQAGNLTDGKTQEQLPKVLTGLVELIGKLKT